MARARLQLPIKEHLEDELPRARVEQLWRGISAAPSRTRAGRRVAASVAIGLSVTIAAATLGLFWVNPSPGALRLADRQGDLPAAVDATAEVAWELHDGSRVVMARGAYLEVMVSNGRSFVLGLRRGRVTFDVQPGGPRVWKIECGDVSIEVIGTRFVVERDEASVRVQVTRGAVLVRGERVRDRATRLEAGRSIVVPLGVERAASAVSAPRPTEPQADADTLGASSERSGSAARPRPGARAASAAPAAPKSSAEALLAAADADRFAGRAAESAQRLERLLREYPGDIRVPLAQFTLARLELDDFDRPARATVLLASALAGALPAALREDALARLVEAHARARNEAAAQRESERYRLVYPRGRHAAEVERWRTHAR